MPARFATTHFWASTVERLPVAALMLVFTQVAAVAGELVVGANRQVPQGDQAVIELHLRQAMRGAHLLGPYSQYAWYHPGPVLYYLLTPLYVLSGSASRSLYVTAGLINLAALGLALVVYRKRVYEPLLRTSFELLLVGAVAEFVGDVPPGALVSTPLTEVWNPTITVIPLLALTILGAGVAAGSRKLAPLVVAVHAFVAQSHVSQLPPATAILAVALVLSFRTDGVGDRWYRSFGIALGLGLALWFPPLLAWLEGRRGNITALVDFALHRSTHLSLAETLGYAVRRIEHPILRLLWLDGHEGAGTLLGSCLLLAQLAGVVLCQRRTVRRSRPFASALALTASVPLPVALLQSTALPSLEPQFYYQSLWYGPVGCVAWFGLVLQGGLWLRSQRFGTKWWVARLPAVPAVLLAASIWATLSRDFARCAALASPRSDAATEAAAEGVRAALRTSVGSRPLALDAPSPASWGVLASLLLQLSKRGENPPIHPRWRFMFGSGARYASDKAPTLDVGLVEQEHCAPLWRAYGDLGLYSSAFDESLLPSPVSVQGEHIKGDPQRLLSGPEPTEGAAWDAEGAVMLLDGAASVTLTLPLVRLGGVRVVADGNDSYVIEGSVDGIAFRELGVVPATTGAGLRQRHVALDSTVPLRALRLRPENGDGAFSLARVELENARFACRLTDASRAGPNPATVCDGASPKLNRPWNARGAVILERASFLTIALPAVPGLGFVEGVMLEGDGNDAYAIEGSRDGTLFSRIGVSAPQLRSGIQHWPFLFNDGASWSYLRIEPVAGDGLFSLSELRPLLAAGVLVDFGMPGAPAPIAGFEVALSANRAYDVSLHLRPGGQPEPQRVTVELNQHILTAFEVQQGTHRDCSFRIPAGSVRAKNEIRFVLGTSGAARPPVALDFRSMTFRPVPDEKG